MNTEDKERLKELIEELKEFSKEGTVIVEGKKDVKSLGSLGIISKELKGAVFQFAESINTENVLILTDFDNKGEELHTKIKEALSRQGAEENTRLRRKFRTITRLSHVEGLKKYYDTITRE